MSLLSSFSDRNKVVTSALSVKYEALEGDIFRAVRSATLRYEFRGMTLAAALECAATMRAQYTRLYWIYDGALRVRSKCMADISAEKEGDSSAYKVVIALNERDETRSSATYTDPLLAFKSLTVDDGFSPVLWRTYDSCDIPLNSVAATATTGSSIDLSLDYTPVSPVPENAAHFALVKPSESARSWLPLQIYQGGNVFIPKSQIAQYLPMNDATIFVQVVLVADPTAYVLDCQPLAFSNVLPVHVSAQ